MKTLGHLYQWVCELYQLMKYARLSI